MDERTWWIRHDMEREERMPIFRTVDWPDETVHEKVENT